jgi:hypothetical protein
MKSTIDGTSWSDIAILMHQAKIESEDAFIRILEQDEQTRG